MRASTATLKVILLDQPTKSGLYPIVIRAQWHGRAEKRTGIAIPRNMWSERTNSIKPAYPNASQLNGVLQRMYTEALNRKVELELKGPIKDVHDIFTEAPISNIDYFTLMTSMIKERSLSLGSTQKYMDSFNDLCRFLDTKRFDVTVMTHDKLMSYGKYMKNKGLMNSTIIERLYNVSAVWRYAIYNELVDSNLDPFRKFNPRRIYEADITKKAIDLPVYRRIEDTLYDHIEANRGDMTRFANPRTDEFALATYVLGYVFGGLAFVDMVNIRKEQISTKRIDKGTYYIINGVTRQKTNRPVPIIAKKDMLVSPIMEYLLSLPGDWFLPVDCHTDNPETNRKHLYSIEKSVNLHLRKATGLNISYYSCRHSFGTHYVNSEGANPVHLAVMMGRSVNGIFRYVKTLTTDEDIIKERRRMGL